MKTVKQILEESQAIDYTDRLSVLSSLGLLEESKVGLVRRSLEKNPMNMTMAESKALKEFVDNILSQMLLEKQDYLSKFDKRVPKGYPSDRDMPTVLILKRKAIRVYPDNQKIALYYSQALDRYISIPYGPKGEPLGMVMNESVDTSDIFKNMKQNESENPKLKFAPGMKLNEISSELMKRYIEQSKKKHEEGKRKLNVGMVALANAKLKSKKSDELTKVLNTPTKELVRTPGGYKEGKKAILQSSAPGAEKLGALFGLAARNKIEKIKAGFAARPSKKQEMVPAPNKQFPTAPQAPMGMFESKNTFRKNLRMIREEDKNKTKSDESDEYGKTDAALDAASLIPGIGSVASVVSAVRNVARGKHSDAALDAAGIIPGVNYVTKPVKAAKAAARALRTVKKIEKVEDAKGLKSLSRRTRKINRKKVDPTKAAKPPKSRFRRILDRVSGIGAGVAGAVGGALGAAASALGDGDLSDVKKPTDQNVFKFGAVPINIGGRTQRIDMSDAAQQQRMFGQGTVGQFSGPALRESNLSLIKKLSKSKSLSESVIHFTNENSVTINKGTAKKIMKVYNSLNESNKGKMEKMLNESVVTFTQAINFAVRQ